MSILRKAVALLCGLCCLSFAIAAEDPFFSDGGQSAAWLQLSYAKAKAVATLLQNKRSGLLGAGASLVVDERTNSLWLQDNEERVAKIKQLVTKLDVPVKQVLIKAKIVNIDEEHMSELGVRLGVSKSKHLSGTLTGANAFATGQSASAIPALQRLNFNMPATSLFTEPASIGLSLAKLGGGLLLDMELSAMEKDNVLDVVASPRLIASNEQSALIESGTEIPYQEQTAQRARERRSRGRVGPR